MTQDMCHVSKPMSNFSVIDLNYLLERENINFQIANIPPHYRDAIAQWLYQTYLLTMTLFDRVTAIKELPHDCLQLVATCCLLISCKINERRPPSLKRLVFLSDGSFSETDLQVKSFCQFQADYGLRT
ncbi:hypothetical protein ROZALSC1DRAFT_26116 [Rozella allomycis CSF55]|uniref:Cyclin N-terminal domain-containing protein n=1 Tax=Rozella allomycis (strain CSF55) TaxID=988480 RepID=A0A4P9Y9K4_ROZAC|nr:hypothetical protein ROZALSC1DRAFT_26116 [Rozella allomycis CSF55]